MKSPIWHVGFMGMTIDLSQLAEVGDAEFIEACYQFPESYERPVPAVGFTYRYRDSPDGKSLVFIRRLQKGPKRNVDLTLVDPSQMLLTVREEIFEVDNPERGWAAKNVIVHGDDDQPIALKHINQDRESLINAWMKWKEIEPEIYAVIRRHLS